MYIHRILIKLSRLFFHKEHFSIQAEVYIASDRNRMIQCNIIIQIIISTGKLCFFSGKFCPFCDNRMAVLICAHGTTYRMCRSIMYIFCQCQCIIILYNMRTICTGKITFCIQFLIPVRAENSGFTFQFHRIAVCWSGNSLCTDLCAIFQVNSCHCSIQVHNSRKCDRCLIFRRHSITILISVYVATMQSQCTIHNMQSVFQCTETVCIVIIQCKILYLHRSFYIKSIQAQMTDINFVRIYSHICDQEAITVLCHSCQFFFRRNHGKLMSIMTMCFCHTDFFCHTIRSIVCLVCTIPLFCLECQCIFSFSQAIRKRKCAGRSRSICRIQCSISHNFTIAVCQHRCHFIISSTETVQCRMCNCNTIL